MGEKKREGENGNNFRLDLPRWFRLISEKARIELDFGAKSNRIVWMQIGQEKIWIERGGLKENNWSFFLFQSKNPHFASQNKRCAKFCHQTWLKFTEGFYWRGLILKLCMLKQEQEKIDIWILSGCSFNTNRIQKKVQLKLLAKQNLHSLFLT